MAPIAGGMPNECLPSPEVCRMHDKLDMVVPILVRVPV